MTGAMSKVTSLSKIAVFYGVRPYRAGEVLRWARQRRQSTIESRLPWWPFAAINGVAASLPPEAVVFEFGGGGSTLWLADLGAQVTVAEHDREWFEVLCQQLGDTATTLLSEPSTEGTISSVKTPGKFFDEYVGLIAAQPAGRFDLVIVDGRARVECGLAAMSKIRPGGIMLLDDSHRLRYEPLREALSGWARTDHRGLKIGSNKVAQTTTWVKPGP
jgi:CheY-like chemotaxis protein